MRKLAALTIALGLGAGLFAPATAQAVEYGPHVQVAKVAKDAGRIGVLDRGDILKFRFSGPVKVTDISSFGIAMKGANGFEWRLENETSPYGFNYKLTENDTLLTVFVNLDPEADYLVPPVMTYPVRLNPKYYEITDGMDYFESGYKIFYNLCGRTECRPINHTRGDLLINKG